MWFFSETSTKSDRNSATEKSGEFFEHKPSVMVATEAAGEGINLQFCSLMVNYDIPWNPNRLEQRMGRIHRYGQQRDCLIFNFVATKASIMASATPFCFSASVQCKSI